MVDLHRRWRFSVCFVLAGLAAPAVAESRKPLPWSQWRGPTGQGYCDDTRVPLSWDEHKNVIWKTPLPGAGNSTPIIAGDRIFLTAASPHGEERYVLCVQASDGKLLWSRLASKGVPAGKSHVANGFASPSCATDGMRVYAFFGSPGIFCYDLDGKPLWHHFFGFFGDAPGWGIGASPVVVDDLVIQNCDNDGPKGLPPGIQPSQAAPADLVAFDKVTGKIRWSTPRNQGTGFSTPFLMAMAGGRIDLILNSPLGVWGYDPHTGSERWHCTRTSASEQQRFGEPSPVANGEMMYVASGRSGPNQGLRLPGVGDVTKSHVAWEGIRRGHRDVSSPILVRDYVYTVDYRGMLTCIELKTGREVYNLRLSSGTNRPLASPVMMRGKLFFLLDDGTTVVIEPGPTPRVVGRNRLGEGKGDDFDASPAIAEGRIYIRSQSYLYCIGETR